MLRIAVDNTARLERLINDIMDWSKFQAGCLKLCCRPCDPGALLEGAALSLRPLWASKGLRVSVSCAARHSAWADPDRAMQVLVNLLSNAVKFTPPRGWVHLAARDGLDCVLFSVEDSGPGIPKTEQGRMFQRFMQGRAGTAEGAGTGLGLALCRAFVELHRGRISVFSREGAGSRFEFTLPTQAPLVADSLLESPA